MITLDKNADYKVIQQKLKEILSASDDIFNDLEGPIIVEGKRLLDAEEQEVKNMLAEKTELEIKIERPKQMGLASIDNIFNKDTTLSQTKIYTGTLRSGQRLEFEGSILVLGDVNGGSEIIAEENIIVLRKFKRLRSCRSKRKSKCIYCCLFHYTNTASYCRYHIAIR